MATYTNDLRLKLITPGDEDGTWGTSTNTNLTLIADGFSYGTKQMAADSNETFTMPDGTADGTRSLYLKITSAGSLTATRTVTLGPNTVSKVWFIENATSGSQSITIAQGSGGTVTIPTGKMFVVYTDGAGAGAAVVLVLGNPAFLNIAQGWTAGQQFTQATLTSTAGAMAWDSSAAQVAKITLTENTTVGAPSNTVAGRYITLTATQAPGNYTLSWNAIFKGSIPTMTATSGARMSFTFFCANGTNWDFCGSTGAIS